MHRNSRQQIDACSTKALELDQYHIRKFLRQKRSLKSRNRRMYCRMAHILWVVNSTQVSNSAKTQLPHNNSKSHSVALRSHPRCMHSNCRASKISRRQIPPIIKYSTKTSAEAFKCFKASSQRNRRLWNLLAVKIMPQTKKMSSEGDPETTHCKAKAAVQQKAIAL